MARSVAALAQQRGGEQAAEPIQMLQRFDVVPKDGGDRRRQIGGRGEAVAPLLEPLVLVPVEIIDQRVAVLARDDGFAFEREVCRACR